MLVVFVSIRIRIQLPICSRIVAVSVRLADATAHPENSLPGVHPRILAFVGGFGVGSRVGSKLHMVAISAAIELFRMAFVSDPFTFAYTNSWIYAVGTGVAAAQEIAGSKRAKPVGPSPFIAFGVVMPFCEAILCSTGFKALGGHAIFDTTIVVGTVLSAVASTPVADDDARGAARKSR